MNHGCSMKSCHCHILFRACSIHTCMLQHSILLEIFRIASIEETKHVLNGNASIQDASSYENIGIGIQFQLSGFFIEQR